MFLFSRLTMGDYEAHHYEKERLRELALPFGEISLPATADLEQVRGAINKLLENNAPPGKPGNDWCFIDSVTAIRFFRQVFHNRLFIFEGSKIRGNKLILGHKSLRGMIFYPYAYSRFILELLKLYHK